MEGIEKSAGLDVAPVSPRGSVCEFQASEQRAYTRSGLAWLRTLKVALRPSSVLHVFKFRQTACAVVFTAVRSAVLFKQGHG